MKTCGLIRQKKFNGMTFISVARDKCIIFISQYELINVKTIMFQTRNVIDDKLTRKEMTYHRIGNKPSSSYLKAFPQYNHHILPPIIKMLRLSHVFLNSISADF